MSYELPKESKLVPRFLIKATAHTGEVFYAGGNGSAFDWWGAAPGGQPSKSAEYYRRDQVMPVFCLAAKRLSRKYTVELIEAAQHVIVLKRKAGEGV